MLRKNGQNFSNTQLSGGAYTSSIVSESYGSRTVIGKDGTSTYAVALWDLDGRYMGSCTRSDAAYPVAIVQRMRLAIQAANFAESTYSIITWWLIADAAGGPALYVYLFLYNNAGTYEFVVGTSTGGGAVGNSVTLGTAVVGTTFYTVEVAIHLDKIKGYFDGAYIGEAANPSVPAYAQNQGMYLYFADTYNPKFDNIYSDVEQVDYSTDIGVGQANNSPANGTVYLIKKAYLDAGIASTDIYERSIADGYFTEAAAAGDYLVTMVLSDNDGGDCMKMNKGSGGNWTMDW